MAVLIGVFSFMAPVLLQLALAKWSSTMFLLLGFVLLGLSYGQAWAPSRPTSRPQYRYTGAALSADLAWIIGAAFAPAGGSVSVVAVRFAGGDGVLLSGVACTLGALNLNRRMERRDR